jgi:hypothetical protein
LLRESLPSVVAAARFVLGRRSEERFVSTFWLEDHFAEYLHAERGLADSHGLTDGTGIARGLNLLNELRHIPSKAC